MADLVCILSRGTYQPYCRSLPEDPLVECFEITDESNIQGLFLWATENIYMYDIMTSESIFFLHAYICIKRLDPEERPKM